MIIFILRRWVPAKTASSGILLASLVGSFACPLLLFLPACVILSSLLSLYGYAHVDALQRSQQMKIQQLDCSEAEIMLRGRKWTRTGPSSNRPKNKTALLMQIKRCFPWRRPLTSLGPPEDAVVCACHRCAGCTRTKSTRTELLNLCQSQFGAIRRMYHELREKDAVLQNVEDPNMRAELEREFEEESASTKRHTICVVRLIGKLFVKKMITLTILCEGFMNRVLYVVTRVGNGESLKKIAGNFCAVRSYTYNSHTIAGLGLKGTRVYVKKLWLRWTPTGPAVLLPCTPLQSYYLDLRLLSLESPLPDAPTFS
ncbi:ubiquitin-conjugating enzyme E2 1 [Trichinella spiralis]|uniref:ubiquitin-conjugating enzyme E2 1 n=1 Tax=Trichinella spiralis TaxID=6334 RepID=UPI0001EFEAB2|nr:ubiquitin-conjugating enzyme E2 1 [Trichinella spiralis]